MNKQNGCVLDWTLDRATGDLSSTDSYTLTYLVFTRKEAFPWTVSQDAAGAGLPKKYDRMTGLPGRVTSVRLDRWNDQNMKAVPSYGLQAQSGVAYAGWKYTVVCGTENNNTTSGGSSSDDDEKPWKTNKPLEMSVNVVWNDHYSATAYSVGDSPQVKTKAGKMTPSE